MADLFNFGNFLTKTNKRREKEAEGPAEDKKESTESQPSGTMSQSDFFSGPEGTRRKPKGTPPASMKP